MLQSYKKDFPLFDTHSGLIYLDSAASAQKPRMVIDGIQTFLTHSYANIHRGAYEISEEAEELYYASKKAAAQWLSADTTETSITADSIIYTYNATYAYNLLAQTLRYSGILAKDDVILLDIAEHHANIVPRQMLAQRHGVIIERLSLDNNSHYDMSVFTEKYTDRVKVISLSAASNVTGVFYDLATIAHTLRPETFFIVDGSQAIPHIPLQKTVLSRADAIIRTGHKMMTDTGLGILYLAKKYINTLTPARGGGGMIDHVDTHTFTATYGRGKFEPGTPHIVGAVSLLKAIEYCRSIGGYNTIQAHEMMLTEYALARFAENDALTLIGPDTITTHPEHDKTIHLPRLGIFSFAHRGFSHPARLGEALAQEGICVRCGGHCTHPLFQQLQLPGSCRMSTYIYNDIADLEKAFQILAKF